MRIFRGTIAVALVLVAAFFALCLVAVIVLELPGGAFQDGDTGQTFRNGAVYLGFIVVAGGVAWKLWPPRKAEPPPNPPGT